MGIIVALSKQGLEDTIAFWQLKINTDYQLMEAAFFAIYTEFDKFLNEALMYYALGGTSVAGNTIGRKLIFIDGTHFKNVVGGGNNKFEINVLDRIHNTQTSGKIWVELFVSQDDPFTKAFSNQNFISNSTIMRTLRNYIAHKSKESLEKYEKTCLNKENAQNYTFIEPYDYLNSPYSKANNKQNYLFFIEIIQDICELMLNPIP